MSRIRHPFPQEGWISVLECTNAKCKNCKIVAEFEQDFDVCEPAERCPSDFQDYYLKYHCSMKSGKGSVRRYLWTNSQCNGRPDTWDRVTDMCWVNRVGDDVFNHVVGECGYVADVGDVIEPKKYYKYGCWVSQGLKQTAEEETDAANVNTNIAVVMFLIVCVIGSIVGYFIRRKRKKSVEMLLCDASKSASIQYS